MPGTVTGRLRADLAREEEWLKGDWDSRSARGVATMERHRAKRDELRALLGEPPAHRYAYLTGTYGEPCLTCGKASRTHEYV